MDNTTNFQDVSGFGKGLIIRGPDPRDVLYKSLMAGSETIVDWNRGYDVLGQYAIDLPIKDQGQSSSCVGQATSYLAEILNAIELKKHTGLSARDVYSRIFIAPDGGAFGYKGPSILRERGISPEILIPSYDHTNPPSEAYMRTKDDAEEATLHAKEYKAKGYAFIDTRDISEAAHAIHVNHGILLGVTGSNQGWGNHWVRPPQPGESTWGHFLVATGYGTVNGKRYVFGPNSWGLGWGMNGFYMLPEEYFTQGYTYNIMTVTDLPNEFVPQTKMLDLITTSHAIGTDQFIQVEGKIHKIPDIETKAFLRDELKVILDNPRLVASEELARYQSGRQIPSIAVQRGAENLYHLLKDAFEPNQ